MTGLCSFPIQSMGLTSHPSLCKAVLSPAWPQHISKEMGLGEVAFGAAILGSWSFRVFFMTLEAPLLEIQSDMLVVGALEKLGRLACQANAMML